MAAKQSSKDGLLFHNVQDLRKRLQLTEHTLENIQALETRIPVARQSSGVSSEVPSSPEQMDPLLLEDLSPGTTSSPPRGSRGFHTAIDANMSGNSSWCSTHGFTGRWEAALREPPRMPTAATSRATMKSEAANVYPSNNSSQQRPANRSSSSSYNETVPKSFETMSSSGQLPVGSTSYDMQGERGSVASDNESLRKKLQQLRQENTQMVAQNHKLLNELESAGSTHHQTNVKMQSLQSEVFHYQQCLAESEQSRTALEQESQSQKKQLQEVGRLHSECQKTAEDAVGAARQYMAELRSVKTEMSELLRHLKKVEKERDLSLESAEMLQKTFEDYQKKAKERWKQFQGNEDHLSTSLQHAHQEREEMLPRMQALSAQLDDLQEEIRRLKEENHVERDTRSEVEAHNMELRTDLAKYTQKIGRLEVELKRGDALRKENADLKSTVEQQRKKLEQYQTELGENHAHLSQLEQFAKRMHGRVKQQHSEATDSGISEARDLDGSYLQVLEPPDVSQRTLVAELKQRLEYKEAEIQQLRCALEVGASKAQASTSSTSPGSALTSLKKELHGVMDRNKLGEKRMEELHETVSRLEAERSKHASTVASLEERLADLEVERSSLNARLAQRTTQLTELQKELGDGSDRVVGVERELRKKASQMASLERQLDEKVAEVAEHISKVGEAEEELEEANNLVRSLQEQRDEKQRDSVQSAAMVTRLKQLQSEQCQEMEQQIEILQDNLQSKNAELRDKVQELERGQQECLARDTMMTQLQAEMEQQREQGQKVVLGVQQQAAEAGSRVRQMESALAVCQEEVKVYIEQMEEAKADFDRQLQDKQAQTADLQSHMDGTRKVLDEKQCQVLELERHLEERQEMLSNSNQRIGELEESQAQLQTQMAALEQETGGRDEERAAQEGRLQKLEMKLRQASSDVQLREKQVKELSRCVREAQVDKARMADELDEMVQRRRQEQDSVEALEQQLEALHGELREARKNLRNKDDLVQDLEDGLARTQDELHDQSGRATEVSSRLQDTQSELHQLQIEYEQVRCELTQAQDLLKTSTAELAQKDQQISLFKQTVRSNQDELRSRQQELDCVNTDLSKRQWELQQRATQITMLDMVVKEHKSETEQRLIRLEGDLKKSQFDAQQRAQQVCVLDDQVQELQAELKEKSLQLQQHEQRARKLTLDLDNKTAKHSQLQTQVTELKASLAESQEQQETITQEAVLARDQLAKLQYELTETRTQLAMTQKDQGRLNREMDDVTSLAKSKEEDASRLEGQLGSAWAKQQQLASLAEQQLGKLKEELDQLKQKHLDEVQLLKREHLHQEQTTGLAHIKEMQTSLQAKNKLEGMVRQLQEERARLQESLVQQDTDVQHLQADLTQHQALLDRLTTEAHRQRQEQLAVERMLLTANETIILKEAEIARLEARISGLQRVTKTFMNSAATSGVAGSPPGGSLKHRETAQPQPTIGGQRDPTGNVAGTVDEASSEVNRQPVADDMSKSNSRINVSDSVLPAGGADTGMRREWIPGGDLIYRNVDYLTAEAAVSGYAGVPDTGMTRSLSDQSINISRGKQEISSHGWVKGDRLAAPQALNHVQGLHQGQGHMQRQHQGQERDEGRLVLEAMSQSGHVNESTESMSARRHIELDGTRLLKPEQWSAFPATQFQQQMLRLQQLQAERTAQQRTHAGILPPGTPQQQGSEEQAQQQPAGSQNVSLVDTLGSQSTVKLSIPEKLHEPWQNLMVQPRLLPQQQLPQPQLQPQQQQPQQQQPQQPQPQPQLQPWQQFQPNAYPQLQAQTAPPSDSQFSQAQLDAIISESYAYHPDSLQGMLQELNKSQNPSTAAAPLASEAGNALVDSQMKAFQPQVSGSIATILTSAPSVTSHDHDEPGAQDSTSLRSDPSEMHQIAGGPQQSSRAAKSRVFGGDAWPNSSFAMAASEKAKGVGTKKEKASLGREPKKAPSGPLHSSPQVTSKRTSRTRGGPQQTRSALNDPTKGGRRQPGGGKKPPGAKGRAPAPSPGLIQKSPNVSTAVAHYDGGQSQDGSFEGAGQLVSSSVARVRALQSEASDNGGYLAGDLMEQTGSSRATRTTSFPEGLDLSSIRPDSSSDVRHQESLVSLPPPSASVHSGGSGANSSTDKCVTALEQRRKAIQRRQVELSSHLQQVDDHLSHWDDA